MQYYIYHNSVVCFKTSLVLLASSCVLPIKSQISEFSNLSLPKCPVHKDLN